MIKKLLHTIGLAALLASVSSAAHATEGWYARGDLGYSVDGNLDVKDAQSFDFDEDWMADVGVGYAFQNGFRTDVELSHRQNDFADIDGDASASALMVNLFYDFNRDGRACSLMLASASAPRASTPKAQLVWSIGTKTTLSWPIKPWSASPLV